MIRGLYTAASGMSVQLRTQEIISNNLANVDTPGYKKDTAIKRAFPSLLLSRIDDRADRGMNVVIGSLGTGVTLDGVYTDFSLGSLKSTENKLDLAIASEGYFVIQTPQGERYTRDGSFTIASNGDLTTKDGFPVMGHRGVVNIGTASDVHFSKDGSVVIDGEVINELRIVNPLGAQALRKEGNNLFALQEGRAVEDAVNFRILQGYLESSNVNPVAEMVKMLQGLRLYEANQRSILFQDETLNKVINEVGRV